MADVKNGIGGKEAGDAGISGDNNVEYLLCAKTELNLG